MSADKIIGRVVASVLLSRLPEIPEGAPQPEPSYFRLDKLDGSQIAAAVREIRLNPMLADRVDLKIPRWLVIGEGLPEEALTSENAGAARNATTTKTVVLTANGTEPGLADTLDHVAALGAKELRSHQQFWVEATCHVASLAPTTEDRAIFASAVSGLVHVTDLSLVQLGEFCSKISEAFHPSRGLPIRNAVGWALPCVGLPRDTSFFASAKTYGKQLGPWRKAFGKLFANRQPLLFKRRPTGQPIDAEDMRTRFDDNLTSIAANAQPVLTTFINASDSDDAARAEVAELEWEEHGVHFIFEKPREQQRGLADETLYFFEHIHNEPVLTKEWLAHLEDLKTREKRSDWNEGDEIFFHGHRSFFEDHKPLLAKWEKIIYGKPIDCVDFLEGFSALVSQLVASAPDPKGERVLHMTVTKGRTVWRERFNYDVGSYFSSMCRGLKELMGERVRWHATKMHTAAHLDPIFAYRAFFQFEKERLAKPPKPSDSLARAAVQIKFDAVLYERVNGEEVQLRKSQLVWSFKPEAIGLTMVDDMKRLMEKGGINCTSVPRRLVSKKGGVQSVSLDDTNTLEATFSSDAGSLVPPAGKLKSQRQEIKRRIDELADQGRLSQEQRGAIREAWDQFEDDYAKAMEDFISYGLHGEAVERQSESYAELLRALAIHARGDTCRSKLVTEVLTIGTVRVSGEQPCIIIPPWHPERMKALAVKTRRVAGLASHLLAGVDVRFGDHGIFNKEFADELRHPFYPEIAIAERAGTPELVAESGTVNGYSLMEMPVSGDQEFLTDVDPSAAAKHVKELLDRYVGLQPHEASNLSVLLYNADAAELPLAVVHELSRVQAESEDEFQCAVAVRHRDPNKLRQVYAELVTKAGDDPDLPVVSETSENFISKLRIAAVPASSTPPQSAGFKPFDIAFLHDVVSRTAGVEWIKVPWANERPSFEHAPSRWSYRSVSGEDELKSTTFLTCPQQTATGWAYVAAVGSVARRADPIDGERVLPARRISLESPALKETLDDAHAMAEWVATYDELLDKRQLRENGITVVRYRRASTNGRNMIVSSTSELRLLGVLARRRIAELGLSMDEAKLSEVVSRAKGDALSVSGDIVMRAAKRGVSAGEMLGLVLSRYIVEAELKALAGSGSRPSFCAFFLLDDYASWLAQKESRIADILALCVEERDGEPHLHIAIVESKYVGGNASAEAKRSSRAQLMATLNVFRSALFGDPGRLDRDVWLSRLADLLLDAHIPPGATNLLEKARAQLRSGEAPISLRGYSHVFLHSADPASPGSQSEQSSIESGEGAPAWQEVFDRQEVRSLMEVYAAKADPAAIRQALGPQTPWLDGDMRLPAPRVTWTSMIGLLAQGAPSLKPAEVAYVGAAPIPAAQPPQEHADAAPTQPTGSEGSAEAPAQPSATAAALPHPMRRDRALGNPAQSNFEALVAEKSRAGEGSDDERVVWADDVTKKLRIALNGYGLQAAVIGTRLTPNGCLVKLAGSDRLRVEDIEAKRMQLLTTHAINLVTVQPMPGEIVVTIAGAKRQSVSLWDLWAKRSLNRNAAGVNTSFVLGLQEINGSLLYLNLGGEFGGLSSHDPHSLVAGATGSGKSVLVQSMLLDIAATNPKELAQIVLIDPKMGVDYAPLEALPHMRESIVIEKGRAAIILEGLVQEMEKRYRLFHNVRANNLTSFNAKSAPESRLPLIFLVHDEFADWMLDDAYKKAVSAAVQRLGVKARAAGIHLIFAAQRPDKDVMPMQLRDNLGNRLILKVASEATSKITLDRGGAELLLGKGHMAAKLTGEQGLVFAQAPFLAESDIELAVHAILNDNK
ncbi:FtsK/SpoIIIE domain-containing protein [Variovorax sp. RTB1]|uniref:FtsK/SpoIIIE domain-containing protein n=1 Tax=Variovorax sp. RTB1 TaxID=3048631 RepID=UPI002B22DFA6|nr:FtsK/SpoIIIE domain-containing protein [Variovorax sp. RTB1]MEB0114278.1 FtsK/SpoIIIE domain-containing protein [Variovorax sp. RTB1]